ncbi:MAG: hypothetical protein C4346_02015 [Chloroflexota bacterium]
MAVVIQSLSGDRTETCGPPRAGTLAHRTGSEQPGSLRGSRDPGVPRLGPDDVQEHARVPRGRQWANEKSGTGDSAVPSLEVRLGRARASGRSDGQSGLPHMADVNVRVCRPVGRTEEAVYRPSGWVWSSCRLG